MTIEDQSSVQPHNDTQAANILPSGKMLAGVTFPDTQVKESAKSGRRQFSSAYKLKILDDYDACGNALARGALLRKEGLYHSRLSDWRKQRDVGKLSSKIKSKTPKVVLLNQKLTRENEQLKKKLAQAKAVIELQKKVSDLLGTYILPVQSNEII